MDKKSFLPVLLFASAAVAQAQDGGLSPSGKPDRTPRLGGTIRAKAEYQTREREARFQVRNARVDVTGSVVDGVAYKAEIDFSDEGTVKMRDAYVEVRPFRLARRGTAQARSLALRLGQMRVPFSIDAHRSPWAQYFANRSFPAKQVGDVRDVGLTVAWQWPGKPLMVEVGAFNGSGLTDQKDYWTRSLDFSAKAQVPLPCGLTLQASVQKVSPTGGTVLLYDGGATLRRGRWTAEAEYQRSTTRTRATGT